MIFRLSFACETGYNRATRPEISGTGDLDRGFGATRLSTLNAYLGLIWAKLKATERGFSFPGALWNAIWQASPCRIACRDQPYGFGRGKGVPYNVQFLKAATRGGSVRLGLVARASRCTSHWATAAAQDQSRPGL
jgi:hypothetical protein